MQFLPIKINGKQVYAGFWLRFGAAMIDLVFLIPLGLAFAYLHKFSFSLAIAFAPVSAFLFSVYNIYFNAKFGGTIGKLAVGIRVTRPDGSWIGWREAWLRSCIDVALAAAWMTVEIYALMKVNVQTYLSSGVFERMELLESLYPAWCSYIERVGDVWCWSELVVLLLNRRRRALHDFIAGTVVIHRQFVQ